ncbi:hypothetical protein J2X06_001095 [Lysobacter niastensis]|uniref:SET domain-containing protein n=1 Tax=Lysobacter niastensis TaxID=380629 RepID=A0ABU1W8J1_9GAMM|nr:SET domain-containing protein [Lysobacter niastensis]MDR7133911.1 hypothetical protein [Lysobacter niastensis]
MQTFVSLGYLKDTGTPKGRGVFASRPITEGEVVELCPALVLTQLRALPRALRNYVYCWSKLAKGPPSSALALGYGSMYNHDNPSNLRYEALPDTGCMRFIAVRHIEAHEELTINYEAEGGGLESDLGNGWFDGAGIPTPPNPLPERRRA